MMKYVYVVSPDFLKPMLEQSTGFSFAIRGYYSIEQGLKHLKNSNVEDILGYAIVMYELPEELGPLIDLLNAIDVIADGHPVVLCTMFKDGLDVLREYLTLKNMKLFVYTDLDSLTDIDIKRAIYGTIVKEVFDPYILKSPEPIYLPGPKQNSYQPIFNKAITTLNEPVIVAPNLHRAMAEDPVARQWLDVDDMLYFLRQQQIKYQYDGSCGNDKIFDSLLNTIKDKSARLLYSALYSLIKEGKLCNFKN